MVSLNFLVGNAGGVNGAEIGYFINTVNYHVRGFQGAGFFNVAVAETNPDIGYLPWHEIGPNWAFFNRTYDNVPQTNVKMWIGIMGGVRL